MSEQTTGSNYPGGWVCRLAHLVAAFEEDDISESGLAALKSLIAEHPEEARAYRTLRGLA